MLLDRGADIEAKDGLGYTPLHLAAMRDSGIICELLLDYGADINAKNNEGKTPSDVAKNDKIKQFLESKN